LCQRKLPKGTVVVQLAPVELQSQCPVRLG
jgi:hypothetical protein